MVISDKTKNNQLQHAQQGLATMTSPSIMGVELFINECSHTLFLLKLFLYIYKVNTHLEVFKKTHAHSFLRVSVFVSSFPQHQVWETFLAIQQMPHSLEALLSSPSWIRYWALQTLWTDHNMAFMKQKFNQPYELFRASLRGGNILVCSISGEVGEKTKQISISD